MLRQNEFENWLKAASKKETITLEPMMGDASFRRYFYISELPGFLAVDAPPATEKTQEFVDIARAFADLGLNVPIIKDFDPARGFLMVSYLGDTSYLQALQKDTAQVDKLYKDAMQGLDKLMCSTNYKALNLETFDKSFMLSELNFFTEWFLRGYLKIDITSPIQDLLDNTYHQLIEQAENQPQVCVHRDYHSRNLIVCGDNNPGIIDFQDAVQGPLTYDLVSMLRDAYVDWPPAQVKLWAEYFHQEYAAKKYDMSFEQFYDDFNLMGIQRHLKATFIFARKWLRDEDPSYLNDIYRTLNYILDVTKEYPQFQDFHQFIAQDVEPKFSLEQAS